MGADQTAGLFLTAFCLASLLVAGLDGCATYHPEPLDAAKTAQQFDSRSLSNPELCQCLGANMGANLPSCQPRQWSLAALTLVGFYYNPDIAVADARGREADAAVITARAVPNPTLHLGPQFREASIPNFAPWGIGSFNLDLPIETAGKHGDCMKPNDWPMLRGSRLAKRQEEEKARRSRRVHWGGLARRMCHSRSRNRFHADGGFAT